MCGSVVNIHSPTAEITGGIKKVEITGQNIMSASAMQGGHKKSPSAHNRTTLSDYVFATKARIDNR